VAKVWVVEVLPVGLDWQARFARWDEESGWAVWAFSKRAPALDRAKFEKEIWGPRQVRVRAYERVKKENKNA
jgi:hypothetical protein